MLVLYFNFEEKKYTMHKIVSVLLYKINTFLRTEFETGKIFSTIQEL